MRHIDVFNGDADGLCALHQLRLAEPPSAGARVDLVTGVKRDIELLGRVDVDPSSAADTVVTVLDVSLDRNRAALERLLAAGVRVRYFDHHHAGDVPVHARLEAVLDASPDVCTAMLVDRALGGRYRAWTVVAAFGDHLASAARAQAVPLGLTAARLELLRELGEAVNYNSYGDSESDVLIHPRELYAELHGYADPFALRTTPLVQALVARQRADLALARALAPVATATSRAAYRLPDAAWGRRVIGAFANALADDDPARAIAVLKERADGSFVVSVRAPLQSPHGADALCRQFDTGGGRAAAGGIGRLPASRLADFLTSFRDAAWTSDRRHAATP